jgi:hypothetical protein
MEPVSLRSRLLAPTVTPKDPEGTSHLCVTTFQVDRSNRESSKVTVVELPGARYTLSKPRRTYGGSFADAGNVMYS